MTDKTFEIKGGALIIGSLLWQVYVGRENNNTRQDWRDNRLDISSKIKVKTPIRYGRVSGGGIYTITFSNSCRGKNIGTGFVVPFRNNPLTNINQLLTEAEQISVAEGMNKTFISSNSEGPWCVLGILFNKTKILQADKNNIKIWWQERLRSDPDFYNFDCLNFRIGSEKNCILSNGQLNIPWPIVVNSTDNKELDSYDFVIATATLPTKPKYPSVSILSENIMADTERKYFLNNYEYKIRTFQDERVHKKVNKTL